MSQIIKRLAQNYVSKLTHDEIMDLKAKSDAMLDLPQPKEDTTSASPNNKIAGGEDYPQPKEDTTSASPNNKIAGGEDYPQPKASYVHRHYLIVKGIVHLSRPNHRQQMAYRHPWVRGYLEKVGKALWATPPIFIKPGQEDEPNPEEDDDIKTFWDEMRLQTALWKCWYKAQVHGIIFYYPMDPKGFFNGYSGPSWYIYSVDELGEPAQHIQGHPFRWTPNHSNKEKSEPKEITVSQGVFYDYKNTDDFTGEPFFIGIWDNLVDWIWITDAINAFDQRMGNGFLLMVVPQETTPTEMTKYETVMMNTRTEKGIVVRGAVDEPVQIEWVGMAGMQVDFIAHLEKIEDMFAFNMGFPKRWIMGDQEGAMESSGKDHLQVNIQLKNLFAEWTLLIKKILIYHGKISDLKDIIIRPPFELQLSEQEQIELDFQKAQTIAAKTWLTINEQREQDGLEPKEGGDDLFTPQMEAEMSQPAEKTKETPKTDAFNTLATVFTDPNQSVRQLADYCNVSPTTISKMRESFNGYKTPKYHEDAITVKCDALVINENLYKIEDVPVVLPQKKYYKEYNAHYTRPREEIERIFNDPKYPKEFRLGVVPDESHTTRLGKTEIPNENTIGRVQFRRLDEHGNIRGDLIYDLTQADKILGKDNFVRHFTEKNENIPTSVALYSREKPASDGLVEHDLDIRSFVFTRHPRNEEAGR